MRADIVIGKVTLNGQVIDNKNAKYPLLTYSNITYFPMTYHLSRFMGVETDWNNAAKSLNITAGGAQSAYVAEPGKAPRGSVSVTLPSYRISVNGALIDNKEATYPIFNYNGVTYFPLTFRYAYESFGWGYQWDAENGLRIDTTSAPAHVPTEPNTGNAALDKALTILNSKYATGGKYHGMLEGGGKKTSFDAALDVSSTPDVTTVKFTAEPFPFFDNGVSYFANYYAVKGGFASDEQISISGNSPEQVMLAIRFMPRWMYGRRIATSANASLTASSQVRAASTSRISSAPPLWAVRKPGRCMSPMRRTASPATPPSSASTRRKAS